MFLYHLSLLNKNVFLLQKEQFDFTYQVKEDNEIYSNNEKQEQKFPESRIKKMFPVGLVHGTYIIAENEDAMFIIDQHAANERINYEKYLKEYWITLKLQRLNVFLSINTHIDMTYVLYQWQTQVR